MSMLGLSERQKRWVAAGVTSIAVAIVCTFVMGICRGMLKIVDLAAPALVPVVLGVLLAMFFKPYYGWFLKRFRNPTLAFIAMSLTVLAPAGLVLWLAGSMMAEQLSAFVAAAPTIVARASELGIKFFNLRLQPLTVQVQQHQLLQLQFLRLLTYDVYDVVQRVCLCDVVLVVVPYDEVRYDWSLGE